MLQENVLIQDCMELTDWHQIPFWKLWCILMRLQKLCWRNWILFLLLTSKPYNFLSGQEEDIDDDIIVSLKQRLNEIMNYELLNSAPKKVRVEALDQLQELQDMLENYPPFNSGTVSFYELKNMVQTAVLILQSAIEYEPCSELLSDIL